MTMLLRQVRHELLGLVRTPIVLIMSVGLPLGFFVLLAALAGNEVVDEAQDIRLVQFLAPGMATFAIAMSSFAFLATALAEARAAGVVKRQSATPVPRGVLLGGRMGASLVLGLVATLLVLGAGVLFYDLVVPGRSVVVILVTLVVSSLCFSALGLALALSLPSASAVLAVSNGVVIPLSFVSGVFMFGADLPPALETIGWLFPLKHVSRLLSDALNPYVTGSGFQLEHVAVILAWGAAGVLASLVLLRRRRELGTPRARTRAGRASAADRRPVRTSAPSRTALVLSQVRHTQSALWRDASAVFFAVAFPVALVAVVPAVNGGGDVVLDNGQPLGTFYAATMAVYAAAVTAYANMPQAIAEDRERGVLKRVHASPMPAWALVVGRMVGAVVVVLVTGLAIVVLAAALYRPGMPPGMPAAVVTLVLTAVCFALVGVAVTTFIGSAQSVVAVTLGTMLPLAFISDIFVIGATLPPALDVVSWVFPLRHAANAMTEAVAPDVVGSGLAWGHLAVLLAWTVAASVVVVLRFRWEADEPRRRRAAAMTPAAARR